MGTKQSIGIYPPETLTNTHIRCRNSLDREGMKQSLGIYPMCDALSMCCCLRVLLSICVALFVCASPIKGLSRTLSCTLS